MEAGSKVSGSLPVPGPIGRSVRILAGGALLYVSAKIIQQISGNPHAFLGARRGWSFPGGDWWLAALVCVYALRSLVNRGFGGKSGEWVRGAYLGLVVAAILWDFNVHGGFWGPPLAWLVLLVILYVFAHSGVSFLVAGIAATPG